VVGAKGSMVIAASPATRESAYLSLSCSVGYRSAFPSNLFFSWARKGRSSLRLPVNFSGSGSRSDLVGCVGIVCGVRGAGFGALVVVGPGRLRSSTRKVICRRRSSWELTWFRRMFSSFSIILRAAEGSMWVHWGSIWSCCGLSWSIWSCCELSWFIVT